VPLSPENGTSRRLKHEFVPFLMAHLCATRVPFMTRSFKVFATYGSINSQAILLATGVVNQNHKTTETLFPKNNVVTLELLEILVF
jgi:hypothetical protein